MNKRTIVGTLSVVLCTPALGDINLELRPANPSVTIGDPVDLGLYAVSDDGFDQLLSALQVILTWDPTFLQLLGNDDTGGAPLMVSDFLVPDPFNLNETDPPPPIDGDGLYVGLTFLGGPVAATPAGTLLTTFKFMAVLETVGTTPVGIPATCGASQCATIVFDGTVPNTPVTGTLDGAAVQINPVDPGGPPSITVDIDIGCDIIMDVPDGQEIDFLCLGEGDNGDDFGYGFAGGNGFAIGAESGDDDDDDDDDDGDDDDDDDGDDDDDDGGDGEVECGFEFVQGGVLEIRSDTAIIMITCTDAGGNSSMFELDMTLAGLDDGDDDDDDDGDDDDDDGDATDNGTGGNTVTPLPGLPPTKPEFGGDVPGGTRPGKTPAKEPPPSGGTSVEAFPTHVPTGLRWAITEPCPADFDGNHVVDDDDLWKLLQVWGPCEDCRPDIAPTPEGDGVVDDLDLLEVLLQWGPC